MVLPMVPYADAGPLYGLVWPILISVAVTPTVWASTGPTTSAVVSATVTAINRLLARMVSSFGDAAVETLRTRCAFRRAGVLLPRRLAGAHPRCRTASRT